MAVQKIGKSAGDDFDGLVDNNRMFKFLLRVLFELILDIRTLKGEPALSEAQVRAWLRGKYVA